MGRVSVQATAVAVGTVAFAALALLTESVYVRRPLMANIAP